MSCTVLLGKLDFLLTCKIHFLEYSTGLFPLLLKIEVCWEWEGFMWGCPSSLLSLLVFNYLNVASYYPVIMLKEEVWVIKKQTYILSYVIAALVHCCSWAENLDCQSPLSALLLQYSVEVWPLAGEGMAVSGSQRRGERQSQLLVSHLGKSRPLICHLGGPLTQKRSTAKKSVGHSSFKEPVSHTVR